MFGPLGFPEIIFILVLALLIFGPKRLPEIGRTIGRGLAEFRKASNELKRTINTELALDEPATPPVRPWMEAPAQTAPRSTQPVLAPSAETETEPDDRPVSELAAAEISADKPLEPS